MCRESIQQANRGGKSSFKLHLATKSRVICNRKVSEEVCHLTEHENYTTRSVKRLIGTVLSFRVMFWFDDILGYIVRLII